MRKFLLAGIALMAASSAALAADIEPPPTFDWTGFYIGGNAGVAINNSSVSSDVKRKNLPGDIARELRHELDSNETVFTGGGEIGYNWQLDRVVVGAEADFNYLGFDESRDRTRDVPGLGTVESDFSLKADWYGTIRARLGFLATENYMIYTTGGAAYGNIEAHGRIDIDNGDFWKASASNTSWGWTWGVGAEYAFDQNWIVGAEYLYVDLGDPDLDFNRGELNTIKNRINGDADFAFNVVRATVKYKF